MEKCSGFCRNGEAAGFTLAELLIALVILGVIAAFTIPKVLQAQQNNQWKAEGKEVASMIAGAYQAYQASHTAGSNTGVLDLTPYMNYVNVKTVGLIDHCPASGSDDCSSSPTACLVLHNGGVLYNKGSTFGQTNSTNFIYYVFDPNAKYDAGPPGEGLIIMLYFNGRVGTAANLKAGDTTYEGGSPQSYTACPDPNWFSWN